MSGAMQVLYVDRFDPAQSEIRVYTRDASGRFVLCGRTPVPFSASDADGVHHSYNLQPLQ